MAPHNTSSVESNGATIHFTVQGQGSAVLLIQGVGVEGRGFAPQVKALAQKHTCVTIDNRGIGQSRTNFGGALTVGAMAEDALAVADALGLARFHLVGHSLGGVVAQRVALTAPHRVSSIVFQCTFAGGRDLSVPSLRLMWLGLRSELGTKAMRRVAFAKLVSPPALIERANIQATIDALEDVFGRSLASPPAVASQQLAALRKHDERERLPELASIPCLVQSATHDPIAQPRFGRELATRIGTASFEEWPNASHALPIQDPDRVNARLLAHFAQSEGTHAS